MKYQHGNWRVMRNCCTSGNCSHCRGRPRVGIPVRIVQANGYSEAYARHVATTGWARYAATAELMPGHAGDRAATDAAALADAHRMYEKEHGEPFDPTPWCIGCGAMKESSCHCGPIVENN